MFAARAIYVILLHSFLYSSSVSECDIRCSNVLDPVCGLVAAGGARDLRQYHNICHLNRIKCIFSLSSEIVEQVPDGECGIARREWSGAASGRRINDFGLVGATQECNHTCPTFCVDTYEPVCAQIWNEHMNKSYSKPIINHCHVDLFSCSFAKNVTIIPLTMCYSTLAKQLQFMSHVAAMKSLGLLDDGSSVVEPAALRSGPVAKATNVLG